MALKCSRSGGGDVCGNDDCGDCSDGGGGGGSVVGVPRNTINLFQEYEITVLKEVCLQKKSLLLTAPF